MIETAVTSGNCDPILIEREPHDRINSWRVRNGNDKDPCFVGIFGDGWDDVGMLPWNWSTA